MENPTSRTTEENWKSFKCALHQAIIKHVPTTKSKTKLHLPWITRNIKCEIRKKDRQYRKAGKSKMHEDWSTYRIKRRITQAQTTNTTCHLHALPAVILRTLYSTLERTYRGSCNRIYHRSIPESRHPSHSDIDIIIDCFSVNHGLPAFLMYY